MRRFALVPLLLLLGACGGDRRDPAALQAARRDRCIAEELAVQAIGSLAKIDTVTADGENPLSVVLLPFARAFHDFAKARERELALMDSAVAAGSAGDSAAFAQRAERERPRAPATPVERNAAEDYQRKFAQALGNPSHPCNQAPAER